MLVVQEHAQPVAARHRAVVAEQLDRPGVREERDVLVTVAVDVHVQQAAAVEGEVQTRGRVLLREMAAAWPFFRATLDNMEMVLAKSDMAIAKRYSTLVQDRALADALFGRIRSAWEATHDCLLAITGQSRLLEKNPPLDASIRLRLPYIEPLNLLQVELLRRYRAGETDARVREGIQLSINAVATALRNSG